METLCRGLHAQNVENSQCVLQPNALKLTMGDMESNGYQEKKNK